MSARKEKISYRENDSANHRQYGRERGRERYLREVETGFEPVVVFNKI
jgi:hypothetical protein